MARRNGNGSKSKKPPVTPVARGEGVSLPRRQPDPSKVKLRATQAGEASAHFLKGGPAFARWCEKQGIAPRERRTAAEWDSLMQEFAARPIHGHRRGKDGGNHRTNALHKR